MPEIDPKVFKLAEVICQDDPSFCIIDQKHGHARSPTVEEKLLAQAVLDLSFSVEAYRDQTGD